jgi:flavin reductase (DIM6/NTAB) family NADH-FMN oxidoreductase RutF
MTKTKLGPQTLLYPMPTLLIGANIDNKPNFMALAWGGIANSNPPMISVAIRHSRHTYKGIKQNGTFSVNIPSEDLVRETDFCGIVSGSKESKVDICKFTVFYGSKGNAPMIDQCPINLECSVANTLDLGSHVLIIGKIEETYVSDDCLTEGKPDIEKVKPFLYATYEGQYRGIGKAIAKAFSVGKELKGKTL